MSRTAFLRLEWLLSDRPGRALDRVGGAPRPAAGGDVWSRPRGRSRRGVLVGAALWAHDPACCCARRPCSGCGTRSCGPFSATLGTRDVVVIAALSGVTEELFFRGVLLAGARARRVEPLLRRAARALRRLFRVGDRRRRRHGCARARQRLARRRRSWRTRRTTSARCSCCAAPPRVRAAPAAPAGGRAPRLRPRMASVRNRGCFFVASLRRSHS